MARVSGPLMSMEASGTIASTLVYSRWKGIPYVRRHAIPSNPRAAKQIAVRAALRYFSRTWKTALGAPQWLEWQTQADTMHMSGFNRFIAVNLQRVNHMIAPIQTVIPIAPGTTPVAPTVTGTGGIGCATLDWVYTGVAPDWGTIIFGALGGAPTPGPDCIIGFTEASTLHFVHTPIATGTWHYILRGFLAQTVWGPDSTDETAIVT